MYIFIISLASQHGVHHFFVRFLRSRINAEIKVDSPTPLIIVGNLSLPFTKGDTIAAGGPILDTHRSWAKVRSPELWRDREGPDTNQQYNCKVREERERE
jgi:hypothetical protein